MAVGSKTFPEDSSPNLARGAAAPPARIPALSDRVRDWAEILLVFTLFEAVLWTPRSIAHGVIIVLVVGCVIWFSLRRNSRTELGLRWPSSGDTTGTMATAFLVAIAIPAVALALGHPVPANPGWPKFHNLWPYVIWAFAQQFLLQSFFFLRLESRVGARHAVGLSMLLFTVAHLPNLALTGMSAIGALFFTETFRRCRSIWPLGIVHALLGSAIAYTFPDSLMHHMRVGLSYWQF
jgi:membrane protease YdiL (CAAX protease family)